MKYCKYCNTENEDRFIFCRNCGAELEKIQNAGYNENGNLNNSENNYKPPFSPINLITDFDGISKEEMGAYIGGSNNQKLLNKLAKMQFSDSKISWCWPVAILSFFFGFAGGAMWLLYRKVYKAGFISAVLGVIQGVANILITNYLNNTIQSLNTFSFPNLYEQLTVLLNIVATVIFGLFSYKWYKDTAISRIKLFKEYNADHPYYLYGVSQKGGTSGGMLAVAITLLFLPQIINTFINSLGVIF